MWTAVLFASAVIHWITSYDQTGVILPPLVISNIEYAVDNSHPSARSRRNTIGAQSAPEWLRPGHLQPGQSLTGMLSGDDDDDKELRFAHHRNLLEIERRSSKGGPSGMGRTMGATGPSSKSAAEDALDSEKAEMMVVAWNAMSDSSSPSLKPVEHGRSSDRDRDRDRDRGKRLAAAVDGLGDADRSSASDTTRPRCPDPPGTTRASLGGSE